jgi:hypothetical protein
MSITPSLVSFVKAEEVVRELPMAPWVYGALAFAGFLLLLAVLWSFRNTGAKMTQGKGAHSDQSQRS